MITRSASKNSRSRSRVEDEVPLGYSRSIINESNNVVNPKPLQRRSTAPTRKPDLNLVGRKDSRYGNVATNPFSNTKLNPDINKAIVPSLRHRQSLNQPSNNNMIIKRTSVQSTSNANNRFSSASNKYYRKLGEYLITKTIGSGSTGKVKLGIHQDTGEKVAIKIMNRKKGKSSNNREIKFEEEEERVIREVAILTIMEHKNIVQLKNFHISNNHYYLVMEYVQGGQLLDFIIENGKLEEKMASKLAMQIISGIEYCHRHNIVHRDLKIENILITSKRQIKLIDFGLSNLYTPLKKLNTFCGSLYFAAPELLNAQPYVGPEVDIWSFGVVLYVLVCGKVPFDDRNMANLHSKIKKGKVEYPQWISSKCKDLLSKILVVDPKKRIKIDDIYNHPWFTSFFNINDYIQPSLHPSFLTEMLPINDTLLDLIKGFKLANNKELKIMIEMAIQKEKEETQLNPNYECLSLYLLAYMKTYPTQYKAFLDKPPPIEEIDNFDQDSLIFYNSSEVSKLLVPSVQSAHTLQTMVNSNRTAASPQSVIRRAVSNHDQTLNNQYASINNAMGERRLSQFEKLKIGVKKRLSFYSEKTATSPTQPIVNKNMEGVENGLIKTIPNIMFRNFFKISHTSYKSPSQIRTSLIEYLGKINLIKWTEIDGAIMIVQLDSSTSTEDSNGNLLMKVSVSLVRYPVLSNIYGVKVKKLLGESKRYKEFCNHFNSHFKI